MLCVLGEDVDDVLQLVAGALGEAVLLLVLLVSPLCHHVT
jgi:hypothetical protein